MQTKNYRTEYLKQDSEISGYAPFPHYLLELPLSMTARVQYSLLLNRARLSQQNGWIDEAGNVFVYFTEAEQGKALHKGRSVIQSGMRTLEAAGLIARRRIPGERGQRIYPKIIRLEKPPDRLEKTSSHVPENLQTEDWKTEPGPPGKPSINKQKDKPYISNQKDVLESKTAYGRYKNVFLSSDQYERLIRDYPHDLERLLDELSAYLEATGKRYLNYEAGVRMWAANDRRKRTSSVQEKNYRYDGEDSL